MFTLKSRENTKMLYIFNEYITILPGKYAQTRNVLDLKDYKNKDASINYDYGT